MKDAEAFDYIVVGAGSAGCVLAARLSADPAIRVLLLEAGPKDSNPFIHMPRGIPKVMNHASLSWQFATEPETGNGGKPESWARGRTIGGSSAINGMVYNRGQPADYDAIAALSSDDWNWDHMGAAFKAIENHQLGEEETRGDAGPLHVTVADRDLFGEAVIAAGEEMGLPRKEDVNAPDNGEGIGYVASNIWKGRRQSSAVAFLYAARRRPNLTIVAEAEVDKVLIEDGRAVGVVGTTPQGRTTWRCRREVILSAGAIHSPAILMRSGIGPADVLEKAGVPVLVDNAEVGGNMLEHRIIVMQWRLAERDLSINHEYTGLRLVKNVAQYYLTGKGPMSTASYAMGAWLKSRDQEARPDLQILIARHSNDVTGKAYLEETPGMQAIGFLLRPESKGRLTIVSADPKVPLRIEPNYLTDPEDRRRAIDLFRAMRRLVSQPALDAVIEEETLPAGGNESDEQIIDYWNNAGGCGLHTVGTCRMGNDPTSVVDPRLRVRGVAGLRVMDTSVPPVMPSGNTNAPMMAMAWRASDLLLEDRAAGG